MNSIWNHRTGRRRLWRLLLLLGMLLVLVPAVSARANGRVEEAERPVQVSFNYTGKCYPLKVSVSGKGTLIDGEQTIREGTLEYELLPGTVKYFTIQPDEGYTLESLILKNVQTGESISLKEAIVNGKFSLMMENKEMVLEVVFSTQSAGGDDTGGDGGDSTGGSGGNGADTDGSGTSDTNASTGGSGSGTSGKDTGSGGAKTMDMTMAAGWMLVMFLSSAILMITVTRRKNKHL